MMMEIFGVVVVILLYGFAVLACGFNNALAQWLTTPMAGLFL